MDQSKNLDMVSPATRLLEKRRQMYEKQQEYDDKKKEAKRHELEFKETEKDLRQKDLQMQESMIQFSVFLSGNEQKKQQAAEKIEKEKKLLKEKEAEMREAKQMHQMLEKKQARVKNKQRALMQYKEYLEKIREQHPEEFDEVKKITERHQVLVSENRKLDHRIDNLDMNLKEIRDNTSKYTKEMNSDLLKLNNVITLRKQELERILDEKNKLKSEAEELNRKKFGKYSDLAQVLMAVNDIQLKCEERSDGQRKQKVKNVIHHKVNWPSDYKPENFNDPRLRVDYAKAQMESIKLYLSDYI